MVSLITAVTKQAEVDPSIDLRRMNDLLSQWHEVDIQITEAANEAKDNVKYLSTLERFFIPLNGNDVNQVMEIIPALLNAVKMIHTISRYFNTTERVTKLFMKISNQLINVCKLSVTNHQSHDFIWKIPIPQLLQKFEKCFQLNDIYRETYRQIKEKLTTQSTTKQFNFPDIQLFGKFDLFCQRITKLMDLFSTIHQYNNLAANKFENLEEILSSFHNIVNTFRSKGHDLFDYHNNRFDRDFMDFNEKFNDLEYQLQLYINKSFENGTMNHTNSTSSQTKAQNSSVTTSTIEKSILLLSKYKAILYRDNLRNDLDNKLAVIFINYGQELIHIEQIYEKEKNHPSVARNMPPVSGNIAWARHLLRRIETPMKLLDSYLKQNSIQISKELGRESKRIIKIYNKLAKTLIAFELLWYDAWCHSIEAAKKGLYTTLIVRNTQTNKMHVNFDMEIFQLIRESRCLVKIGMRIPETAQLIVLQEEKFKSYYNDLKYLLLEYDRILHKVVPIIKPVLEPLFVMLEEKLRPGLVTLTWSSLNIDQYKQNVQLGLTRLDELVNKVNDIIDNRIQKNLRLISKTVLVALPTEHAVTVEEFVSMQEAAVRNATHSLSMKNIEIENAVYDIFDVIALLSATESANKVDKPKDSPIKTNLTGSVSNHLVSNDILLEVHQHFQNLTYQAILSSIKTSLIIIKKRAHARSAFDMQIMRKRPFFEVDVQLSVSNVRLSPNLHDIQRAINRSTVAILSCAKKIYAWDIRGKNIYLSQPEQDRVALYDKIGTTLAIDLIMFQSFSGPFTSDGATLLPQ